MHLEDLGWDPAWGYHADELAQPAWVPGRLATVDRGRIVALTAEGEKPAEWRFPVPVAGEAEGVMPAVGDWGLMDTVADPGRLVSILPRRTLLARGLAAGSQVTQPLAANVDLVLIVTGLDRDFSLRRIERFLALARSGSARAVVVLSKRDLTEDPDAAVERARKSTNDLSVLAVSSVTGDGLSELRQEIGIGRTAVLVGSSGAGKSTLINRLLGEARQRTGAVRSSDDRGRHVTTRRELLPLPGGGLVIDTPGLREVGILADQNALLEVFSEIAELESRCRFNDCLHLEEPGCAVREAVANGEIDADRLDSFHRLAREQQSAMRRASEHERRAHERATIGHYRKILRDAYRIKGREE
jgi:ribosome biogenesis GTPase